MYYPFREGEPPCEPSAGRRPFEHRPAGPNGRRHRAVPCCEPWPRDEEDHPPLHPPRSFLDSSFRDGEAPSEPAAGRGPFEHRSAGPISRWYRAVPCCEPWQRDGDRISIPASESPLLTDPLRTGSGRSTHMGTAHMKVRPPAQTAHIEHDLNTVSNPRVEGLGACPLLIIPAPTPSALCGSVKQVDG